MLTIHNVHGCLPKLSQFLTSHTYLVILVIIFLLTLEMIAVLLHSSVFVLATEDKNTQDCPQSSGLGTDAMET